MNTELIKDTQYATLGETATARVKRLLGRVAGADNGRKAGYTVEEATENL